MIKSYCTQLESVCGSFIEPELRVNMTTGNVHMELEDIESFIQDWHKEADPTNIL